MRDKWLEKCKQLTPAKLKRNLIILYGVVLLVAGIFYVIGRINLIEIAITYIILAFCIVPVLKI